MKELYDVIANLGFPIAVSAYLLFRFEKKLEALEDAIQAMKIVIDDNNDFIKQNNEIVKGCSGRKK